MKFVQYEIRKQYNTYITQKITNKKYTELLTK